MKRAICLFLFVAFLWCSVGCGESKKNNTTPPPGGSTPPPPPPGPGAKGKGSGPTVPKGVE